MQEDDGERWLVGGSLGSRSCSLVFRCSVLSSPAPNDLPALKMHMAYKTIHAETKLLTALLTAHGFTEITGESNSYNILWTGVHPKPQVFRSLASHQRLNHFPRSYELTRKDRLYKNIERMQYLKGMKHFDFIPQTYIMPNEFKEFATSHHRLKGPWIVKPVASSRGRGIYIVNSPEEVPTEEPLVVAKYIDKPLLVVGHKCDLRLYVAVTSYDPLVAYLYEEGLVRFAAVKYDYVNDNFWNPCMHLCNYSINKHHTDYVKSDDAEMENVGHKWTLSALLRHLRSKNVDTALLMHRIEETIIKSLLATAAPIVAACKLFVPHHSNCFELYGFDLLVDASLKPWLLEVNLSPSLGCDSPLDTKVKSALLADLLTLVGVPPIDPMATPPQRAPLFGMRVGSADTLPSLRKPGRTSSSNLSTEESKIVAAVNSQFSRRAGFVRIFPTASSWKLYSRYLDPATGIPGSSASTTSKIRNFNLMLHRNIFVEPLSTTEMHERIKRYERVLTKGYTVSLQSRSEKNDESLDQTSSVDARVIKKQMLECLQEGFRFSQVQSRTLFGQYLRFVLSKLSAGETSKGRPSRIDDNNLNLVLKFLQRAASTLKTSHNIKVPNKNMSCKDRMAIVAKQLSDFLYEYTKETESIEEKCKGKDTVPYKLFQLFLSAAQESDLEEVLQLSAHLYTSQLFLGKCNPSVSKQRSLALLQPIGRHKNASRGFLPLQS